MTPAVETPKPGEALQHVEEMFMRALVAGRLMLIGQAWGTTLAISKRLRHPRVAGVGLGLISGQAAWASLRNLRGRSARDEATAWSDVSAQLVALLTEAGAWGARAVPPEPRWSETFGVVLAFGLPMQTDGAAPFVSLASWLATYYATTSNRTAGRSSASVRGQRSNEMLAQAVFTVIARSFVREVRRQGIALDEARADAVQHQEQLASEREQQRQHRLIHDSALQVLETIAGSWYVDDDLLARRIDYECARMRRMLDESGDDDSDRLATSVTRRMDDLVWEYELLGVRVEIVAAADLTAEPAVVETLCDATHEALMNVKKHAGVDNAIVEVAAKDGGIAVVVTDRGIGFDPEHVRSGFGLRGSIDQPLRELGGYATVRSAPGKGTEVTLWLPTT